MSRQKGQSLVEFAFVLPVILLLIIGCTFLGMVFADYVALNSLASRAAREASLATQESEYRGIEQKLAGEGLPADVYLPPNISIAFEEADRTVAVTVRAKLNPDSGFNYVQYLGISNLNTLQVVYRMYSQFDLKADKK